MAGEKIPGAAQLKEHDSPAQKPNRREGQSQLNSFPHPAALLAGQHSILQSWVPTLSPRTHPQDAPKAEDAGDAGQRLASSTKLKNQLGCGRQPCYHAQLQAFRAGCCQLIPAITPAWGGWGKSPARWLAASRSTQQHGTSPSFELLLLCLTHRRPPPVKQMSLGEEEMKNSSSAKLPLSLAPSLKLISVFLHYLLLSLTYGHAWGSFSTTFFPVS